MQFALPQLFFFALLTSTISALAKEFKYKTNIDTINVFACLLFVFYEFIFWGYKHLLY